MSEIFPHASYAELTGIVVAELVQREIACETGYEDDLLAGLRGIESGVFLEEVEG